MMGVGKTTIAKKLASKLNWRAVDLDEVIEDQSGLTIQQYFQAKGENDFRRLEQHALRGLDLKYLVVSVGGGTPAHDTNAEWMAHSGFCIWLDAPVKMLVSRIVNSKKMRPLVEGLSDVEMEMKLQSLMELRTPFYIRAHMILNVQKLETTAITELITEIIRDKSQEQAPPRV